MKAKERRLKIDKINKLRDSEISKIDKEYIKTNTKFKVGDTIEFIEKDRDGDYDYNYNYRKGEIKAFNIECDGDIYVYTSNIYTHEPVIISDIKLFKEDDYTLRDSIKGIPELDINEKFYIIKGNKQKRATKGKQYKVIKKEEDKDGIIYTFYNDKSQPSTFIRGEYRTKI